MNESKTSIPWTSVTFGKAVPDVSNHSVYLFMMCHVKVNVHRSRQWSLTRAFAKLVGGGGYWSSLKRKCNNFDEIFITGCTGSCYFDNFQCSQWWKFHLNDNKSPSVSFVRQFLRRAHFGFCRVTYLLDPIQFCQPRLAYVDGASNDIRISPSKR